MAAAKVKEFMDYVIENRVNLEIFFKMFQMWNQLDDDEKVELNEILMNANMEALKHKSKPKRKMAFHCNSCGRDFASETGTLKCHYCGSNKINKLGFLFNHGDS